MDSHLVRELHQHPELARGCDRLVATVDEVEGVRPQLQRFPRAYPGPRLVDSSDFAPYVAEPRGYYTTLRAERIRRSWAFVAGVVIGVLGMVAAPAIGILAMM